MKRSKCIFCFIFSFILIISIVLPCYAISYIPSTTPDDIGILITDYDNLPNGFYYLRVKIINNVSQELLKVGWSYVGGSYNNTTIINCDTTNIIFKDYNERAYYLIKPLYFTREVSDGWISAIDSRYDTYYFPLCIAYRDGVTLNIDIISTDNIQVDLYSININEYDYDYIYYQGYDNGYDVGFNNASNINNDLNLVDKITEFISRFTGNTTAVYITPLAICMILILIYCLFIRWILNLARSSKLTKLTDIVVIVSCIAILLIYYIPMIDFTINQNQTVENIYRVINDVNVGG